MDENVTQLKLKTNDNRKYEVGGIQDSTVYKKEFEAGHFPSFYYLILWKSYLKKENTWESASVI